MIYSNKSMYLPIARIARIKSNGWKKGTGIGVTVRREAKPQLHEALP